MYFYFLFSVYYCLFFFFLIIKLRHCFHFVASFQKFVIGKNECKQNFGIWAHAQKQRLGRFSRHGISKRNLIVFLSKKLRSTLLRPKPPFSTLHLFFLPLFQNHHTHHSRSRRRCRCLDHRKKRRTSP